MLNRIKDIIRPKKWTLYLYYNGVMIKKIRKYETEALAENYAIKVYFKKFLFGNTISKIVVKPVRILKQDGLKRKTHLGVVLEQGVEF
jgi:hypothetical protein